jgi:hypothetical protein
MRDVWEADHHMAARAQDRSREFERLQRINEVLQNISEEDYVKRWADLIYPIWIVNVDRLDTTAIASCSLSGIFIDFDSCDPAAIFYKMLGKKPGGTSELKNLFSFSGQFYKVFVPGISISK